MLLPEPAGTLTIVEIKGLFAALRLSAELEILSVAEEVFVLVPDDELFAARLQGFPIPPNCFSKFFSAIEAMFQSCVAPRLDEMLHTAIMRFGG